MASRWSHAHGKTGAELVPSSWQPTRAQSAKDKTLFYRDNQATAVFAGRIRKEAKPRHYGPG